MTDSSLNPTLRTLPLAEPALPPLSSLVRVDFGALSHAGCVRPNNEDQFFVTKQTRSLDTMLSSLPPGDVAPRTEEVTYVMVVADGMGGHAAGEVASRLAITTLVDLALEVPDWFFTIDEDSAPRVERRARELIEQVGAVLKERGGEDAALRGMGTTLTGARSFGRDLLIVHVGDSRAYLFRQGCVHRLTRDHTYAQMLVDADLLEPSAVAGSNMRHILTRALGGSADRSDVDVDLVQLEDGDRLLLCSDGLTDLVDDAAIARTLAGTPVAAAACARLVEAALDAGGRDNVTVVVAAFSLPATIRR